MPSGNWAMTFSPDCRPNPDQGGRLSAVGRAMTTPVEPGQPERSFFQRHPFLLVLLCLAGLGVAAIASNGNDKGSNTGQHEYTKTTKAREDAAAQLACGHFRNVANDAGAGILSDTEFRDKIKEVHETASVSDDPDIRLYSQELLAAVTQQDIDRFTTAATGFASACSRLGQ